MVDYGLARSSISEGIRKESLKQVSEQAWTQRLHLVGTGKTEDNGTQQKIRMAETYIKENYNTDLNMAVVSNYISMNYSLFSYEFKQYTGKNMNRD